MIRRELARFARGQHLLSQVAYNAIPILYCCNVLLPRQENLVCWVSGITTENDRNNLKYFLSDFGLATRLSKTTKVIHDNSSSKTANQ